MCIGYWTGVGLTLPITRSSSLSAPNEPVASESKDDESEDEDEEPEHDLSKVEPSAEEDCKLVRDNPVDSGTHPIRSPSGPSRQNRSGYDKWEDSRTVRLFSYPLLMFPNWVQLF